MGKYMWFVLVSSILTTSWTEAADLVSQQFQNLAPGLTATVLQDLGTDPCNAPDPSSAWVGLVCDLDDLRLWAGFDALGGSYGLRPRPSTADEHNCPVGWEGAVYEIVRHTGTGIEIIGALPQVWAFCLSGSGASACRYPDAGCVEGSRVSQEVLPLNFTIDTINGNLYVALRSSLDRSTPSFQIVRISGLVSLLDIISTFQPASEMLSWVAPKHPEALPAADRFQVYAGDLASLREDRGFTRAAAIDCSVPDAGAPRPGDFLTALGVLPDPPPGQAAYALIGVEYQGQRRFGRQNIGGVLSGRDPSLFRGCS